MNTIRVLILGLFTLLQPFTLLSVASGTLTYSRLSKSFTATTLTERDGYIQLSDSSQTIIDKAEQVIRKIEESNNYIRNLSGKKWLKFPVGIKKSIAGVDYTIGIHALKIYPQWAEIEAFLQIKIPQSGQLLTFAGTGIRFSNTGGIIPGAKLYLVNDFKVPLGTKGTHLLLNGGSSGSFVSFNCSGFEALQLSGQVQISDEVFRLDDGYGQSIPGDVNVPFQVLAQHWNDVFFQFQLPSVQLTKTPGFRINGAKGVLDLSDNRDADFLPKTQSNGLWRGFAFTNTTLYLPPQFHNRIGQSTSININYLTVDETGVNFDGSTTNLIPLNEGDMRGVSFSVDSLYIQLKSNRIQQFSFTGLIDLPVSESDHPIHYAGTYSNENRYLIQTDLPDSLVIAPLHGLKTKLYPQSSISIEVDNRDFIPNIQLYGETELDLKVRSKSIGKGKITFENLQYIGKTEEFSIGQLYYERLDPSDSPTKGLHINRLEFLSLSQNEGIIKGDISVNLGTNNQSIYAASILTLKSTRISKSDPWNHQVSLEKFEVNASTAAFQINGLIELIEKENESYYSGFVDATFTPGIEVKATAIFGEKEGVNYWYFDALASFSNGLPLGGNVAIYGIGGGAYHHVRPGGNSSASSSGIHYQPDTEIGNGFKASVILGSYPNKGTFEAEVSLEMAFTSSGGLERIVLQGEASFAGNPTSNFTERISSLTKNLNEKLTHQSSEALSSISVLPSSPLKQDGINGHILLEYDHINKVFHGNLDVFVHLGEGNLTGIGKDGLAGQAVIHFEPGEWYIHLGTPEQPLGLQVQAGKLKTQLTGYFVAGSILPSFPPLSDKVAGLAGINASLPQQETTVGSGFIFGGHFQASSGEQEFLMFYGSFDVGAGFDLMFQKSGFSYCGSNGANWMATGQAYAYLEGLIGIKIDVFGQNKRIDIIKLSTVAVLDVTLPAPTSFHGIVGGDFEILGGLIKGNCRFEVELGNRCKETSSDQIDADQLISDVSPAPTTTNVSVFSIPQVGLNIPINQPIAIPNGNQIETYRIQLESYTLDQGITGSISTDESQRIVRFNPDELLPENTKIQASAIIKVQQKVNGSWIDFVQNSAVIREERRFDFTTGKAPENIPIENILYQYPAQNEIIYTGESDVCYLKLNTGQAALFTPSLDWKTVARYSTDNETLEVDPTYNQGLIEIPLLTLQQNTKYRLSLVRIPLNPSDEIAQTTVSKTISNDSTGNFIEMNQTSLGESLVRFTELELWGTDFITSSYRSLQEEMNALESQPSSPYLIATGIHQLNNSWISDNKLPELFSQNLTNQTALDLSISRENNWIQLVEELIYSNPSFHSSSIKWRSVNNWGILPLKALKFGAESYVFKVENLISLAVFKDFNDIKSAAAGQYLMNPQDPNLRKILDLSFPSISFPTEFKLQYQLSLPGGRKGKSNGTLTTYFQ